MIIVDRDTSYCKRLLHMFNRDTACFLEMDCFTDWMEFVTYSSKNSIDLLLIEEELYEQWKEEDYVSSNYPNIIVLTENKVVSNPIGTKVCYKYQRCEAILKVVQDIIDSFAIAKEGNVSRMAILIAFYSPVGGVGTTTISTSYA